MTTILLVVTGFISGALPLAVWLGRYALRTDIRRYGDGNPGASNVLRAGGKGWGALALLLEVSKGLVPVALANFVFGLEGAGLVAVALAPVAGHAFSPFLRLRGGKAVAATFGVWCGLTIWEGPTMLGLLLGFWYVFINESGWAVLLCMLSFLAYLLLAHPDGVLLAVWAGNCAILLWKHRVELVHPPTLQAWYRDLKLPWHT